MMHNCLYMKDFLLKFNENGEFENTDSSNPARHIECTEVKFGERILESFHTSICMS